MTAIATRPPPPPPPPPPVKRVDPATISKADGGTAPSTAPAAPAAAPSTPAVKADAQTQQATRVQAVERESAVKAQRLAENNSVAAAPQPVRGLTSPNSVQTPVVSTPVAQAKAPAAQATANPVAPGAAEKPVTPTPSPRAPVRRAPTTLAPAALAKAPETTPAAQAAVQPPKGILGQLHAFARSAAQSLKQSKAGQLVQDIGTKASELTQRAKDLTTTGLEAVIGKTATKHVSDLAQGFVADPIVGIASLATDVVVPPGVQNLFKENPGAPPLGEKGAMAYLPFMGAVQKLAGNIVDAVANYDKTAAALKDVAQKQPLRVLGNVLSLAFGPAAAARVASGTSKLGQAARLATSPKPQALAQSPVKAAPLKAANDNRALPKPANDNVPSANANAAQPQAVAKQTQTNAVANQNQMPLQRAAGDGLTPGAPTMVKPSTDVARPQVIQGGRAQTNTPPPPVRSGTQPQAATVAPTLQSPVKNAVPLEKRGNPASNNPPVEKANLAGTKAQVTTQKAINRQVAKQEKIAAAAKRADATKRSVDDIRGLEQPKTAANRRALTNQASKAVTPPQGFVKNNAAGDFASKGAHVHVKVGNKNLEIGVAGDGKGGVSFSNINALDGKGLTVTDPAVKQAVSLVRQRLATDATFRNSLRDATNAGAKALANESRRGQLRGARELVRILDSIN